MPSVVKKQFVTSLVEKLEKNPNFVLVDFGKATHRSLEELREKLREADPTAVRTPFSIIKNSLFRVAAAKLKKPEVATDAVLTGPSALLTLPTEWISVLQTFYKFATGDSGLKFKVGVIDGAVYQQSDLVKLAKLPSREVLISKIIGSFKTPQTRLVYSMKYNISKLVYVLNSKAKQS